MTEADRREYELSFKEEHIDIPLVLFDSAASTNDEAKAYAECHSNDAVFIAKRQTAGKGRLGRSFYSPADTGLYFTVIIPPCFDTEHISLLTPAAAVAVTRALERASGKALSIKWVNDIYLGDRKICGILAESVIDVDAQAFAGFAVGIGINLSTEYFPGDISGIAASLGACADRNVLAAEIACELFAMAEKLSEREFLEEYRAHSYVTGKDIYFIKDGVKTYAHAVGIDSLGGLEVRLENGEKTVLRGGEISVRIAVRESNQ